MVNKEPVKVVAVIQARMGSTRLPGKCMLDLCGRSVLSRVIDRVKIAGRVKDIYVATSSLAKDDVIEKEARKEGVKVFRGSEEDVLERYCGAAEEAGADYVVRVTADNPLTDPALIDMSVEKILEGGLDYVTYSEIPYGSNSEVVSVKALRTALERAEGADREHVTSYIYSNPEIFRVDIFHPESEIRRPDIRVTMDTNDDYARLLDIFRHFQDVPDGRIDMKDVVKYLDGLYPGGGVLSDEDRAETVV